MARYPLGRALKEHGCNIRPSDFQDLLEVELARQYPPPHWTVDELLCNPRDAILYCDGIRNTPEFSDFPDPMILHALMARRKAGKKKKR